MNKSKNFIKQIDDLSLHKEMKNCNPLKKFLSHVRGECQLGAPSAKPACPTAKQSASGTRARSKFRPEYNKNSVRKYVANY